MTLNARWMLPEGIEELLPGEAKALESLRRSLLDDLDARGFELVTPPIMEFVDALLTGTGEALDTQTYKFMDQHTQRMLGIRADMTPQIARIDAHYLSERPVNRLCYAGTVLRTRPEQVGGQRELLQIGAEVFGIAEVDADLQILDAMLGCLMLSGAQNVTLSLGHEGIYSHILDHLNLPTESRGLVLDALQRRSLPDLQALEAELSVTGLAELLRWQGDVNVIELVRQWSQAQLSTDSYQVLNDCLEELNVALEHIATNHPAVDIHVDLADVSGYRYHTGLKYTAFISGRGRAIAKGGRYDRVGEQFGRARPATGFSADVKALLKL